MGQESKGVREQEESQQERDKKSHRATKDKNGDIECPRLRRRGGGRNTYNLREKIKAEKQKQTGKDEAESDKE